MVILTTDFHLVYTYYAHQIWCASIQTGTPYSVQCTVQTVNCFTPPILSYKHVICNRIHKTYSSILFVQSTHDDSQ